MKKGVLSGLGAYLAWGFFPVYFKALQAVPSLEVVAHRMAWSFVFAGLLITLRRDWKVIRQAGSRPRVLGLYALAGLLLGINWLVYVHAVQSGQVVEASLGYFINPLVSVLMGVIFLRERLRPWQWVAVGLAAAGVIYLTAEYGAVPWISLALALSFASYGLVKKLSPLGSLRGLTLETAVMFLPATAYLLFLESQGSGAFGHSGWNTTLLLAISGVVTSLPLLLFATAAQRIPLSLIGLLQYLTPSVQFLLGVLVYREPFSPGQLVGFSIIWLALVVFTGEGFTAMRKAAGSRKSAPVGVSPK